VTTIYIKSAENSSCRGALFHGDAENECENPIQFSYCLLNFCVNIRLAYNQHSTHTEQWRWCTTQNNETRR